MTPLIVKRRRDGWVILYRQRVLCGIYATQRDAKEDRRGIARTLATDSQLKEDLDRWANLETEDA